MTTSCLQAMLGLRNVFCTNCSNVVKHGNILVNAVNIVNLITYKTEQNMFFFTCERSLKHCMHIYTVSQKWISDIIDCSLKKDCRILIILVGIFLTQLAIK